MALLVRRVGRLRAQRGRIGQSLDRTLHGCSGLLVVQRLSRLSER